MDETAAAKLVKALLQGDGKASIDLCAYVTEHPAEARYLVLALGDALSNLETRDYAAFALGEIGPLAARVVPQLIEALNYDPENYSAVPFALALGKIGKDAKSAVPALIDALDVEDPNVDFHVAEALGRIGPDAAIAVPRLEDLAKESHDVDVRNAASHAISLTREQ